MASLSLTASFATADSVVTTTSISVAESCTLSGVDTSSHTATINNGTYSGTDYSNGIGQTTLKAFCNDGMGFAIYAIGYTNDEFGNTKLHWSGASNSSDTSHDISTGIYNSGSTTNSTWSMKLASVAGTYAPTVMDGTSDTENFTTWHVVPEEYTKVAYKTTGTDILVNDTGTGASVTVTYDAYISATQPSGTYTGQVKYTLVHPNTAPAPMVPLSPSVAPNNTIVYAPNTSDTLGDMSSLGTTTALSSASPLAGVQTQTMTDSIGPTYADITSNSEVSLIAPNFYREGYGFAGWSTDFTATNSSTIYGPNETISTNPQDDRGLDVTSGAILYPVWVASSGTLQEFSCANSNLTQATYDTTNNKMVASLSSVTALTDTRDGNVYAVAKLADGQCWMIENLRLDNTATISTSDTHNPLHGINNNVTLKIDYANNTVANHLAATSDSWCTSNGASCDDQTMLNTNNTNFGGKNTANTNLTSSYNGNNNSSQWYSYGNYYNWYSATAGNGTYSKSSGNVDGDLCPTGWHLPYGDSGTGTGGGNTAGGFYYLNAEMSNNTSVQGSKDWRSYPNNFVCSGNWNGTQADNRSSGGLYWSSSAYNSYGAYKLDLLNNFVYPGTSSGYKYLGFSVRCIAGS